MYTTYILKYVWQFKVLTHNLWFTEHRNVTVQARYCVSYKHISLLKDSRSKVYVIYSSDVFRLIYCIWIEFQDYTSSHVVLIHPLYLSDINNFPIVLFSPNVLHLNNASTDENGSNIKSMILISYHLLHFKKTHPFTLMVMIVKEGMIARHYNMARLMLLFKSV